MPGKSIQISKRQRVAVMTGDGKTTYLGLWVDDVQIAGAVRQSEFYVERHNGAQWALWSSGLHNEARPVPVRDEQQAWAWLRFLGTLAEHGPKAVTP